MKKEDLESYLRENKRFVSASIGILFLYSIVQLFLLQTHMHPYDSFRDLTIIKEIAERGTFSYFGQAYVINPPLNYLIRGFFAKVVGFGLFSQKVLSILMFFGGQLLIYLTSRNIWDRDTSLYIFLVSALTWSFVLATRFRSFAYMLLFGAFTFYSYTRYLDENSRRNAALVGISLGLGMLAKSSFAFMVILLSLHFGLRWLQGGDRGDIIDYGVMGSVALALYVPYLAYHFLNGLPMPWTAQMMSITGNAQWLQNSNTTSHLVIYRRIIEFYPVMTVLSAAGMIGFREKIKEKLTGKLGFIALVLILGPLLGRIVVSQMKLYMIYFVYIPLPLLAIWSAKKFYEKYNLEIDTSRIKGKGNLIAIILVLSAGFYGGYQIQSHTSPSGEYFSDSFIEFTESLSESDTVLSDKGYVQLHALSDGYVDYAENPGRERLMMYGADYYISGGNSENRYLEKTQEITVSGREKNVYSVDQEEIRSDMNLTSTRVEIKNSNGDPVSFARCIIAGQNWRMNQVSGMDGEIQAVQPANYSGPTGIVCEALGYKRFRSRVSGTANAGSLNPLIHGFTGTRY